mgnify:CR=1 FL=1
MLKLNLTLLEKEYLIKLIKEDKKAKQPLADEFCVDTSALLQYLGYWPWGYSASFFVPLYFNTIKH